MVKKEARILGIDDSPFDKFRDKEVLVIGTFFRGGSSLDGVLTTTTAVDGSDATAKIIRMVKKSKFYTQLRAIMLNGIAVWGFNVVDILEAAPENKDPRRCGNARLSGTQVNRLGMKSKVRLIENNVYVDFERN